MDEALEVVEAVADSELEGALVWVLRVVGLLAVVSGLGLWLFTEAGLLVLPAVLIVFGLVLVVVPGLLLTVVEVAA